MAEMLTQQQQEAIRNRGGKLLVSAAAGSGKTKVLVDRLLSYILDTRDPANIDDFLIITYTKAAAAELRGKIAAKLSELIALSPENRHLQRQLQRLYLAKISTVHSFCGDIIRENAYRLNVPADFRVADDNECQELQVLAMEQILEAAYANIANDPDFQVFVDSQGLGRDDRQVPQIVLSVYNRAMCHLSPDKWLDNCLKAMDVRNITDAGQTIWGRMLIDDLHDVLDLHIDAMSRCASAAAEAENMEKPAVLLADTVNQLRILRQCDSWDGIVAHMNIDYGKLTFSRKCDDAALVRRIKTIRTACKEELAKKRKRFSGNSLQILADLSGTMPAVRGLIQLVRHFREKYALLKQGRRILDFADLEHRTLDLLVGKSRGAATLAAEEIGSRFREIMVDEYQDSNEVQDAIFSALTERTQSCFMVGDVKQSIYQFRLADPGIFLEKYNSFKSAEKASDGEGRTVLLSKNFRSSGGVIAAVNDVFQFCMSKQVGGLGYGENERLYEGVPHTSLNEPEIEMYGIQIESNTYAEEATFTANRISELINKHTVREKDSLRPITPGDIVILLRSPGSVGYAFYNALVDRGIACEFGNGADLLQSEEIESIRSVLQIISNPLQDIPLVAAMTSRMFCFTANDLATIRAQSMFGSIYNGLKATSDEKVVRFLDVLTKLRSDARSMTLTQLIDQILIVTKFDSILAALPDADERLANLQQFLDLAVQFERRGQGDLLSFLDYLATIEANGIAAQTEKQSSNCVKIMSIHKSKGLEFPVVFLCGLSKSFNMEDSRAQVLCDSKLGIGVCCVDGKNRIRYPSIAKHAIAVNMHVNAVSEELRVLYVAMTRARDRLIMTYASKYIINELNEIADRLDMSDSRLLTSTVACAGEWVLQTVLQRQEASAFFDVSIRPECVRLRDDLWKVALITEKSKTDAPAISVTQQQTRCISEALLTRMQKSLGYRYPHMTATQTPSKITATQLKGRYKDQEASEGADRHSQTRVWRAPSFTDKKTTGTEYGNIIHSVMEHIDYTKCRDAHGVEREILRLQESGFLSADQANAVDCNLISNLFSSEIGMKLRSSNQVYREFKFSILDDAANYNDGTITDKVLLQGVVDCIVVENDGITVIDFKTDRVTIENLSAIVDKYRPQVDAYANAVSRIFECPVKQKLLYFFQMNQFIPL